MEITVPVFTAVMVIVVDPPVTEAVPLPAAIDVCCVQKATKFVEVEVMALLAVVVNWNKADVPELAVAVWVAYEENMYCRFVKGAATRKLQEFVPAVAVHVPGPEGNPPPVP